MRRFDGAVAGVVAWSVIVLATPAAPASDTWPSFRGERALAVAPDDPRLPVVWSPTQNVVWRTEIPGLGWSSPVVWQDQVFVTTVIAEGEVEEPKKGLYFGGERKTPPQQTHEWVVFALDAQSGAVLWRSVVHRGVPTFSRHIKNSYASETPVTDGERVYAYFGNLGVFALDIEGRVLWEKRFEVMPTRLDWGTAASPVLHDDLLFIVNDNDRASWFAAIDKTTGAERWRQTRDEKSNWATPFVWQNDRRTEVVTAGTGQVRSYGLDGTLLWSFGGMSSITIPQPFAAHGLLYVASGYVGDQKRPIFAIRPGASGDISLPEGKTSSEYVAWFKPKAGPYNPTPLVFGDYFFTLLDRGFFTVHDARTGAEVYFTDEQKATREPRRRIAEEAGAFTASPWAYNGRIFALSEDGDTYVIDPAQGFTVVGKNALEDMGMATPAIAHGSLYLRTKKHLYRLSNQPPTE